eukprot:9681443-Lingulodinium_polyedra.AAC.1
MQYFLLAAGHADAGVRGDREASCVAGGQEEVLHPQGPAWAAAQPREVINESGGHRWRSQR